METFVGILNLIEQTVAVGLSVYRYSHQNETQALAFVYPTCQFILL
jgi:hypothetical protein